MTPMETASHTCLDVTVKAFLARLDQVRGQEQEAVGAGFLRGARQCHRHAGTVAATGDDGCGAGRRLGGAHHGRDFVGCQREEFPRSPGREQHARLETGQPGHMLAIGFGVEAAVRPEWRYRKGQKAGAERALQGVGLHGAAASSCVTAEMAVMITAVGSKSTTCMISWCPISPAAAVAGSARGCP